MTGYDIDVCVVGDGPGGLATALALLAHGRKALVVGRGPGHAARIGEHLAPDGKASLAELGLLERLPSWLQCPCPRILSCWGTAQPGCNDYIFSPYGQGLNLARPAFDAWLRHEVEARDGTVLAPGQLRRITRSGARWRLDVTAEDKVRVIVAGYLIDATGRAAALARRLGARVTAFDRLVGLEATLPASLVRQRLPEALVVEAVEAGWWYAAELPDGAVRAVFLTDADLVRNDLGPEAVWRSQLHLAPILGQAVEAAPGVHVRVVPARSQCLTPAAGGGWLAVGDAALACDPLASAGIVKALRDALAAADVVCGRYDEGQAAAIWCAEGQRACARYLYERAAYYRVEARWPEAPFWYRRHRSVPAAASDRVVRLDGPGSDRAASPRPDAAGRSARSAAGPEHRPASTPGLQQPPPRRLGPRTSAAPPRPSA